MSEPTDPETVRALALTEASIIAAQVAALVKEFKNEPFRYGVEMACEEMIERLEEAGAYTPKLPTPTPSR